MKKITFLIAFASLLTFSSIAQTCGNFSVKLEDSWIGGWEGGNLAIYINGTLFTNSTQASSNVPVTVQIPVDNNDIISFDYTAGSNASENKYTVYDQTGTQVAVEGTGLAIPGDIGDYNVPSGITACQTTGINSLNDNLDFAIFPNPSNGIFSINVNTTNIQNLEIKVSNAVGQVVYTKSYINSTGYISEQIDLSNNVKGIYFVTITTDKGVTTQKLLIK